jgi:phosphoribosylformylglycinamidine cyclo-ligase
MPLFQEIQDRAQLDESEMFRTFNMGIGLVLVVAPKEAAAVQKQLKNAYVLGQIERGSQGVRLA